MNYFSIATKITIRGDGMNRWMDEISIPITGELESPSWTMTEGSVPVETEDSEDSLGEAGEFELKSRGTASPAISQDRA